jgi:hypothetical protein
MFLPYKINGRKIGRQENWGELIFLSQELDRQISRQEN